MRWRVYDDEKHFVVLWNFSTAACRCFLLNINGVLNMWATALWPEVILGCVY